MVDGADSTILFPLACQLVLFRDESLQNAVLRDMVEADDPHALQSLMDVLRIRELGGAASSGGLGSLIPIAVTVLCKHPSDAEAVDIASLVLWKALEFDTDGNAVALASNLGAVECLVVCSNHAATPCASSAHLWRALAAVANAFREHRGQPCHLRLAAAGAPEAAARALLLPPAPSHRGEEHIPSRVVALSASRPPSVARDACRVISFCVTELGVSSARVAASSMPEVSAHLSCTFGHADKTLRALSLLSLQADS